jgi:hypothetical protein
MSIRKTGSATGQVTGVETPEQGLTAEAARRRDWTADDDQALAEENTAADQGNAS